VDVSSSGSISGLKSWSCWLPWAYASRLKNWALGTAACEYTLLGGKLTISEHWNPSLSPGDTGGIPGEGGVSSGVGCLCRSGECAPISSHLWDVSWYFVVRRYQGRHRSVMFWRSIAGCLSISAFTFLCQRNSTPCFFYSQTSAHGFLIRYRVSSIVVCQNPPLAMLAIFQARRMSDCPSCTLPPCLAVVAGMLKAYKILVPAWNNEIWLLPHPYTPP